MHRSQPPPFTFPVHVTCGSCKAYIQDILEDVGNQLSISNLKIETDLIEQTTTVNAKDLTSIHEKLFREKLKEEGYLREEESIGNELNATTTISKKPPLWVRWLLGSIGVISGLAMLALMLSGIGIPFSVMVGLGISSAVISLGLGYNTIYQAFKKLFKSGALTMDTLFAVGGLAAIAVSIAHLFIPALPMVFDAALLIFGFQHIGDAIKQTLLNSVTNNITFSKRIQKTIKVEGSDRHIPIDKVQVGSTILLARGSVIPIDGVVLDDEASICETIINGDLNSHCYIKDSDVKSGMRIASNNINEKIRIKTTSTFQNSSINKLDNELYQALNNTPKLISLSEKALRYFIPAVILLAILSFAVVGLFVAPFIGLQCAIAVLVSACPCTLGLITPLAVKIGMAKAEQQQVRFKNADKLQIAGQIDTVVFDLNGTLTTGKPTVVSYETLDDPHTFLSYVAALEEHSDHAFANSISKHAKQNSLKNKSYAFSDIRKQHCGISAKLGNKHLAIGNRKMMESVGADLAAYKTKTNPAEHIVYVAMDNTVIGHFVLRDPLRPGAKATINELIKLGKEVHICTGADKEVAEDYAKLLGIPLTHVLANCKNVPDNSTSNSKSVYIKYLQALGKYVAMIGDGGNDVISMLYSNLGIAIQSASSDEITLDHADVTIESASLSPIVALFETAEQTLDNIKQNLIFSLSYNMMAVMIAGGVLIALGFLLNPGIGAALMVLQTAIIMANVYRFKQQSLEHTEHAISESKTNNISYTSAELRQKLKVNIYDINPANEERIQATGFISPAHEERVQATDNVSEECLRPTF